MPDKTASGRKSPPGRAGGHAPARRRRRTTLRCRPAGPARAREDRPGARRRRSAGRHLRGRRAARAGRLARRPRPQPPRRLCGRLVGRLRRRGARQRHFAGADVPAVHRRRRRRGAQARDLPASGVRRIRPPPGRAAAAGAARVAAVPARPVPPRHHGIVRHARAGRAHRHIRQPRDRRLPRAPVRGAGPHQRLPASSGASCSWWPPTSTPARR